MRYNDLMQYVGGLIVLYFLAKLVLRSGKWAHKKASTAATERSAKKITPERYALLETAGYFKYADSAKLKRDNQIILDWLKPENKALGDPSGDDYTKPDYGLSTSRREYFADGENLAEGDIEKTIQRMNILKDMGVKPKITTHYPRNWPLKKSQKYHLQVNGKNYTAWTKSHVDEQTMWGTATACLAAIIDDLLAAAGHQERLYMLYAGGNEALALIMTPEQYKLLQSFGKEPAVTEQELSRDLSFDPRSS